MKRLSFLCFILLTVAVWQEGCSKIHYEKRHKDNPVVTLQTNHGDMTLELFRDVAPAHVDSFVARSTEGFYDGTIFHRIIDSFMVQGGSIEGTGRPNVKYTLDAEFSDLQHQEGTLAMARSRNPNSASTQFYIVLTRERSKHLDGQYTVFGHLVTGYEVLREIGNVETDGRDKPLEDVVLTKAFLSNLEGKPE